MTHQYKAVRRIAYFLDVAMETVLALDHGVEKCLRCSRVNHYIGRETISIPKLRRDHFKNIFITLKRINMLDENLKLNSRTLRNLNN